MNATSKVMFFSAASLVLFIVAQVNTVYGSVAAVETFQGIAIGVSAVVLVVTSLMWLNANDC